MTTALVVAIVCFAMLLALLASAVAMLADARARAAEDVAAKALRLVGEARTQMNNQRHEFAAKIQGIERTVNEWRQVRGTRHEDES